MFAPFSNNRLVAVACSLRLLLIGVLLTSAATFTFAAPIPGLFNTGVDNSGNNLPFGSVDPHWILSVAPSGGGGPNAIVADPRPGSWVANTPDSQWVANKQDQLLGSPMGNYRYDLTFDLTGFDESTAAISGLWSSDNGSQLLLNNVLMDTHVGGAMAFKSFDSLNFAIGFAPGINVLSVVVNNLGGPTGVHVDSLFGTVAIPEPGSALLALLGMTVCGFISRRKRAAGNVTS